VSKIFISHSTKNNDFAEYLAEGLREAGFDVWIDLDSIRDGAPWLRSIETAIHICESVVVVMSKIARESEWVEREVLLAMDLKKRLYIALVEDMPLPLHLINRQFTDFRDGDAKARAKALKKLIHSLRGTPPKRTPKPLSPTPDKSNFFKYVDQLPGEHNALIARDVFKWATTHADIVEFGGKVTPGFHARVELGGDTWVTVFSLWAYKATPAVQVQFQYLSDHEPYTDHSLRLSTLQSLNRIMPENERLLEDSADRRPTLPLETLSTADHLELFKQIMAEVMNTLRAT